MNRIWLLEGSFATDLCFVPGADGVEPITITFFTAPGGQQEFAISLYTGRIGERPSPAAELILTLETFDKDFFKWGGSMFVSERMRQAMALDEPEVLFYQIDASRSAPLPRSKNYMIMQPGLEDDVSDPENSIYEMTRFMPQAPLTPAYIRKIALRPDFAPDCDLFLDSFFGAELFCTDAFASRVLKTGCTGVTFTDPASYSAEGDRLCRTRRGIERAVDLVDGEWVTELVEAID